MQWKRLFHQVASVPRDVLSEGHISIGLP